MEVCLQRPHQLPLLHCREEGALMVRESEKSRQSSLSWEGRYYRPSSCAPEIIASTYLCLLHTIIVMESGTLPSKLTLTAQLRSFKTCQSVESRQRNSTNEQTNKRKKRHVDGRVHWDGSRTRLKKELSSMHCRVYNQYLERPDDGEKTMRDLTVSETG